MAHIAKETGLEITEEDTAALAAEAEAGYDLSLATEVRVGRPAMEEGTAPRLTVRLPRSVYQAAQERAAREGRSLSDLAREAISAYVRH